MTTRRAVEQFLAQKRLALAGASRSGKKFGNTVHKELMRQGYDVVLVHPEASEIDGHKCWASVADLPPDMDGLVLVVPPDQSDDLVKQAAAAGIRNVWMQQRSETEAAVEFCAANGINEVHGECILMHAQPTGFHKFHRLLWGLLGKLPKDEA